jgi:hypothetical protein
MDLNRFEISLIYNGYVINFFGRVATTKKTLVGSAGNDVIVN